MLAPPSHDKYFMVTFKQFLKENGLGVDRGVGDAEHRKSIERWFFDHLDNFKPGKLYLTDDGIDYEANMVFKRNVAESTFPFKMNSVDGDMLFLSYSSISSFENFPKTINGSLQLNNAKITSVDGIPSTILGSVELYGNKIRTLKDIHKKLKKINGFISIDANPIRGPILGLILIEGIRSLRFPKNAMISGEFTPRNAKERLMMAFGIVNKHIKDGKAGVLAAQDELESHLKLEEFAGL